MIIYFRACEKQETISYVTRYNNTPKTTMIKKCWASLQFSVTNEDTVVIIHDNVSDDTIAWLKNNCNTNNIELVSVPEHEWSYHEHTVTLINTLEEWCNNYPDELHYIVEDDYLHVPNAIRVLEHTFKDSNYFILSYDYIDRYTKPEACVVLLGPDRHWRTVTSSTMTVMAKGKTWLDHIVELKAAAPTSNDQVFADIYKITSCLSPIPSLSSHMTDRHQSPFVDWKAIWESIDV